MSPSSTGSYSSLLRSIVSGFLTVLTSPLRVYNRASSGVYVSLLTAPIVRMSKTQEVGVRAGMSMTLVALSAIAGPPISGAINGLTGGFKFTGVYAGALFPSNVQVKLRCLPMSLHGTGSAVMLSVGLMIATRYAILGKFWGKC